MLNKIKRKVSYFFAFIIALTALFSIMPDVSALQLNDTLYVDTSYTFDVATTQFYDLNAWVIGHEHPIRRRSDGAYVYCTQAHVQFNDNSNVVGTTDDSKLSNLSEAVRKRIKLIAYYGFGYVGHTDIEWYGATQTLLWQYTDAGNSAPYPIEQGDRTLTRSSRYDAMWNEIEYLVDHHPYNVSFDNQEFNLNIGETITLTDTNGVLGAFFEVPQNNDFDAEINGNNLIITANKKFDGTIDLIPKTNDNPPLIYDGAEQQVLSKGDPTFIKATIKFNVIGGKITLNKKDKDTRLSSPQGDATLGGAKYNIYYTDTDELVATITTSDDGTCTSEELPYLGSYYALESDKSEGYLLDNTKYYFEITKDNINPSINVYEKIVENYINILKQFNYVDGNTTFLNAEENITFEIYSSKGVKYSEITTDKNGYVSIVLPYGIWKFHQVNTNTGYEKIYDFNVIVNYDSENEQYYNILNNKLSAYLQVIKIDEETGKTIAIADTTFKILNKDTNQYVSQYVGGKVYNDFKTDETGTFITYLKLEAGNYKLIEVSSPNGYLINEDGLDFTIGDDTKYNYTTYGTITTINYSNKQIKGQIQIIKTGEKLSINDGTYNYDDTASLKGVVFNLYANEDIKTPDGNYLYYYKGDLVTTLTTDDFGIARSDLLPLGEYILVEVETDDNYVLDTTEYEIDLKEIDNRTAIVYNNLKLNNLLKKGTLEFSKTDLTDGKGIPNTKVEIYYITDESEELVFTGVTDEFGLITINDLFVGKFAIIETDASTGYKLSDEIVYFEIKEDGEIVKANMTNEKIKSIIKIHKVDENDNPIAGVEIGIFDLNDNLITTLITDDNGDIEIELEYGSYYYQELKTIDGYVLNDEKVYFDITEDGEIIQKTLINNHEIIEVPDTLINDDVIDYISIILIALGLGFIVYYAIKKK